MRMFVSLGSNIDPRRHLADALAELRRRFEVVRVSAVYRTAPVGDSDQPDFWNLAAEIQSEIAPQEVQRTLHEIENLLGRRRDPGRPHGPRTADLDLVFVCGVAATFGTLELPSPLVAREPFVAVPLADLAPDLKHPHSGLTLRELASDLVAASDRPPRRVDVELGE